jgi:hypothetical protein
MAPHSCRSSTPAAAVILRFISTSLASMARLSAFSARLGHR